MATYSFTSLGQPLPKERPRLGKGKTYTPKKTLDAEQVIAISFRNEIVGYGLPRTGRFAIGANFYLKRDYGADIDNLMKTVMDGLQGFAYINDSQVRKLLESEILMDPKNPRTEVRLVELDDA